MVKEQYINMRNTGNFQVEWFYNYFVDNGGSRINFVTFSRLFSSCDLNQIVEFLDKKFNLTLLFDARGNFVKVVI
jgi:hypothetical protein